MRPVRLVAEGFAAFRERIDVDFEAVDFFALVGPTGSGKSSVVDVICFALYGCVPRYEDQRMVAPAITMGALEAKVSLEFEAMGSRYLATRVVRRQGPKGATTKEARLERVTADGSEVLAGTADEVERWVEALLGLPFDHFTKCVVLPQGDFARFLHDKPAARQDLLAKLLNLGVYTTVGEKARQLAEVDKSRTALQRTRLEELAYATPEAAQAAAARHDDVRRLRARVHDAAPMLEKLEREIREQRDRAADAARLAAALAKVEVPAVVLRQAETLAALQAAAAEAAAALDEAVRRQEAADAHLAGLPELGALQAAARAHADLERCRTRLEQATHAAGEAQGAESAAAAALDTAVRHATDADAALDRAKVDHAAHDLAGHLVKGQPCPVCLQPVDTLPEHARPADLRRATSDSHAARQALEKARAEHTTSASAVAAAATRIEEVEDQRMRLEAAIAEWPDAAALAVLIGQVQQARGAADDARAGAAATRKTDAEARAAVGRLTEDLQKSWTVFDTQRDAVAALDPPKPGRQDLAADWHALEAWAGGERPRQEGRSAAAHAQADERQARLDGELDGLADACRSLGVGADAAGGLSKLREVVAQAETEAQGALDRIRAAAREATRVAEAIATLEEEAAVAAALGKLLAATGFERWLVAEALDSLVLGASETLGRLSSGQYALARDERNEFLVIDHANADETRLAKTLSGGETFQASLALALALADQLAGLAADGAAKLDSIFLDEGFGTLDPETLTVVADTIETLGQEDRMVGVITHVKELADRIPVRYQVTKGPRTSTVVRVTT